MRFLLHAITDYWHYWGFQRRIRYQFKNLKVLKRAFTHPSVHPENNQRLEFLGDSVLGLVVADVLYTQHPELNEGALTQLKIMSVKNENLRAVAHELRLDEYLLVGQGLTLSSEKTEKMHADTAEALIGAIYVDGGFKAAKRFVDRFVIKRFGSLTEGDVEQNPKTKLSNWAVQQGWDYPTYRVTDSVDPPNEPAWTVKCSLKEIAVNRSATATTKKRAETLAAEKVLEALAIGRLEN